MALVRAPPNSDCPGDCRAASKQHKFGGIFFTSSSHPVGPLLLLLLLSASLSCHVRHVCRQCLLSPKTSLVVSTLLRWWPASICCRWYRTCMLRVLIRESILRPVDLSSASSARRVNSACMDHHQPSQSHTHKKRKGSIYIAPFIYWVYLKALRHGSHSFTCKYTMPAFPS